MRRFRMTRCVLSELAEDPDERGEYSFIVTSPYYITMSSLKDKAEEVVNKMIASINVADTKF
jgi:hypothetical protein